MSESKDVIICKRCGTEVGTDLTTCPKCGEKLKEGYYGTAWMSIYTALFYIRIVSLTLSLASIFTRADGNLSNIDHGILFLLLLEYAIEVFTLVNFTNRTELGYAVNLAYIFLSPLISGFNVLVSKQEPDSTQIAGVLIACGAFLLIWSLPNYIYFKHRKHLFNSSSASKKKAPENIDANRTVVKKIVTTDVEKCNEPVKRTIESNSKSYTSSVEPEKSNIMSDVTMIGYLKKNLAIVVIIAVLAAGLVFSLAQCFSLQKKIGDQQETLRQQANTIQDQKTKISSLELYKNAVVDFYLDNAVVTAENDKYYHRFGCLKFDSDTYYIYNVENAKAHGYSKCPSCFDQDAEEYCDKTLKFYFRAF